MKNKMMLMFMVGIMFVLIMPCALLAVHVNVTVKVVDEGNIPIDQANVRVGFRDFHAKGPGEGWGIGRVDCHPAEGKTNADGMFSASDNTSPNVVVTVTKPGYYESNESVFSEVGVVHEGILIIVLKKIKNPVPMYAKKVSSAWTPSKIPVLNQDVGYDLEVGDWVAPHGKGKTSDFVFNMDAVYKSWDNRKCNCTIKFSNDKDGIQEYNTGKGNQSVYRWPYEAPESGYLSMLEKYEKMTDGKAETNIIRDNYKMNYIFRVRTKLDENGNIVEAKYGKISGDIAVYSEGDIEFIYYFNPSGNRSLEFDTEKNLFIPEGAKKWKKQYNNYINFGP